MSLDGPGSRTEGATLSATLRMIRRHRGLRVSDLAAAMNLSQRTYEQFESGRGRLNIDYVRRFARATDSDAFAILAALQIGSPDFARRCADNKLMTILAMALREFDEELGDGIAQEDARTLIEAFSRTFRTLADGNRRRAADLAAWLARVPAPPADDG